MTRTELVEALKKIWAWIVGLQRLYLKSEYISSAVSSLVLLFYFTIFILISLTTLSSHQLQYSIQSYKVDGKPLSISQVTKTQAQIEALDRELSNLRFQIIDQQDQVSDLRQPQNSAEKAYFQRVENALNGLKDREAKKLAEKAELLSKQDPAVEDFINFRKFLQRVEDDLVFTIFVWIPDPESQDLLRFSEMPPNLLTMLLVLFMGALGGTIHLTKMFLDRFREHQNKYQNIIKSVMYYLFRPILGAVTAFAVFILAKAGVLVISLPTSPGSGSQLNPYFISFLGLISGILAEEALDTIRKTGSTWFASNEVDQAQRWALDELISKQPSGPKKEQLAKHIGVSKSKIDKWLTGKLQTPPEAQKLIAAWYNKPIRDLFSDIEPPRANDEEDDD